MEEEKKKPTVAELERMMDESVVEILPDGTVKSKKNLMTYVQEELEKTDGSAARIEREYLRIKFQLGPVRVYGVNGCQIDEVVQILINRLEGFQRGEFSCRENALAITKLQEALHWLDHRTRNRGLKGVEGKNET